MGTPSHITRVRMIRTSQILIFLTCLLCLGGVRGEQAEVEVKESRAPRLFYVSTTSSTTTIFTQTICYMSTATAPVACGKRKKRFTDLDKQVALDGDIQPFRSRSSKQSGESLRRLHGMSKQR